MLDANHKGQRAELVQGNFKKGEKAMNKSDRKLVGFRPSREMRDFLTNYAHENHTSIYQVLEDILSDWVKDTKKTLPVNTKLFPVSEAIETILSAGFRDKELEIDHTLVEVYLRLIDYGLIQENLVTESEDCIFTKITLTKEGLDYYLKLSKK